MYTVYDIHLLAATPAVTGTVKLPPAVGEPLCCIVQKHVCVPLTPSNWPLQQGRAGSFGWASEIRVHIGVRTFQACVYAVNPSSCRCCLVGVLLPMLGENYVFFLLVVVASRWLSYVHRHSAIYCEHTGLMGKCTLITHY